MKRNKFASKKLVVLMLSLFIVSGCNQLWSNKPPMGECLTEDGKNKFDQPLISKEVAVLIARGQISYEYDPTYYDEVVFDEGLNWKVGFKFKSQYQKRLGGQPTVFIEKTTGNVVDSIFPK